MSIRFDFLNAGSGDCTLIQTDDCVILLDTGDHNHFIARNIKTSIQQILDVRQQQGKSTKINHIILTHIDDDHIGGLKILANDDAFMCNVEHVWFNYPNSKDTIFDFTDESSKNSARNADKIRLLIKERKINHVGNIDTNSIRKICLGRFIELTLLSPTATDRKKLEEKWNPQYPSHKNNATKDNIENDLETLANTPFTQDRSIPNGSSIAFILSYKEKLSEKNFLFLADAYPKTIIESLRTLGYSIKNPLNINFLKVSHHGSKKNTNLELLNLIHTNKYIIMADGENKPHKETIARIIKNSSSGCKIVITQEDALKALMKKSFCRQYQSLFDFCNFIEI